MKQFYKLKVLGLTVIILLVVNICILLTPKVQRQRTPIQRNIYEYNSNARSHGQTLIQPWNGCRSKYSPKTLFVIGIGSAVSNINARQAIRKTWANEQLQHNVEKRQAVKLLFFVGLSKDPKENRILAKEAEEYQDIHQGNFIDTYYNLTLKTKTMLQYFAASCQTADFLLKADDDTYINIPLMFEKYASRANTELLVGSVMQNGTPFREKEHKWYISRKDYPGDKYPTYLSGGAYLMSRPTAVKIIKTCENLKSLPFEDLWFTGFCAQKVNIIPKHDELFDEADYDTHHPCVLKALVALHRVDINYLKTIWRKIENFRINKRQCWT